MLATEQRYVEVLSDFTTNRDQLADKLFLLKANGAIELFPEAVQKALTTLSWREKPAVKAIIIAGNEEFEQGNVAWQSLLADIREKEIHIINVFCGSVEQAQELGWVQSGVDAGGAYTTINKESAQNTVTPFDKHVVRSYLQYLSSYSDSSAMKMKKQLEGLQISPAYRDLMLYRFENRAVAKDVIDVFDESGWDFSKITPDMLSPEQKALDERVRTKQTDVLW